MCQLPHYFTHQEDRAQHGLHPQQPQVPSEPYGCRKANLCWCQSHFPVGHPVLSDLLEHLSR